MRKQYPHFGKGELSTIYSNLPKDEREMIDQYITYRSTKVTSKEKLDDIKRHVVQVRYICQKNLQNLGLEDLREFLSVLNSSDRLEHTRNDIKANLKNFLKWKFKDWSKRFDELKDIKSKVARNEKKLNSKNMLSKEDIEKLMRTEGRLFWKAFLITQYEAGLRTKEVRYLKWEDIHFNEDGDISELNIYSTKTRHARSVFVKEATYYLSRLREEQERMNKKGLYVFHSKQDVNKPVVKPTISIWLRDLSKRALGREIWAYLLRHSRGTELYRLARQNKIAKETATGFMGHKEDMSSWYTSLDSAEIKTMLKEQVYKLEDISPDKKHSLELEIEKLKSKNSEFELALEEAVKGYREVIHLNKRLAKGYKFKKEITQ